MPWWIFVFVSSSSPAGGSPVRVAARRPGSEVNQLLDNYDKGAAGVFDGTVDVVTGISLEEQRPNMNLDFHFVRT
jgi:hypothetical protein